MRPRRLNQNGKKPSASFFVIMAAAAVIMFAVYLFVPIPEPVDKYVLLYGIPLLSAIGIFINVKGSKR